MNILENVLRLAPEEWEDKDIAYYKNVRYRLYELHPGDKEYTNETNPFFNGEPRLIVRKLERIQNPYILGRFLIRKEQLEKRGEHANIVKYYHLINSSDLKIALEHNMDTRRYNRKMSGQSMDRNPLFYKSPGQAYNACGTYLSIKCDTILVCDVLGSYREGSTTYKKTDTEYMPTYVVHLE